MQKTGRMQKGRPVKKKNKYSVVNIGKTIILVILGLAMVLGIFLRARHFIVHHLLDKPHEQTVKSKPANEGGQDNLNKMDTTKITKEKVK